MSAVFKVAKGELMTSPRLVPILEEVQMQARRHKVKVTIQMDRADRSEEQNNALFGVAYPPIINHTGYRKEELHEVFCRAYFGEVEHEIAGRKIIRPARTTTTDGEGKRNVISKIDFANFYAFIQEVASQHWGVYVPDPDKNWRESLEHEHD